LAEEILLNPGPAFGWLRGAGAGRTAWGRGGMGRDWKRGPLAAGGCPGIMRGGG
jgi:hypothetical protein